MSWMKPLCISDKHDVTEDDLRADSYGEDYYFWADVDAGIRIERAREAARAPAKTWHQPCSHEGLVAATNVCWKCGDNIPEAKPAIGDGRPKDGDNSLAPLATSGGAGTAIAHPSSPLPVSIKDKDQ